MLSAENFLCINIKSASNLRPGVAIRGATCDPFVHITLEGPRERGHSSGRRLLDVKTRVLYKNEFPIWEESYAVALDNVTGDSLLTFEVLDQDLGALKSEIGQVKLHIKDILERGPCIGQELVLEEQIEKNGKQDSQGTLVFGLTFVSKKEYRAPCTRRIMADSARAHGLLSGYALHIQLDNVTGLAGLPSRLAAAGLKVEFSLCGTRVVRPLPGELLAGEVHPPGGLSVEVELGEALREAHRTPRQGGPQARTFGDIELVLLSAQGAQLAKTQVPIWDVPFPGREGAAAAAGDDAAGDAVARPGPGEGGAPPTLRNFYARRMHPFPDSRLGRAPTATLSVWIARPEAANPQAAQQGGAAAAAAGGGGGGGGALGFDAPDVDAPRAPLCVPAFEGLEVADFDVPMGPHAACRAIFGPEAPASARAAEAEDMADVRCEEWAAPRDPGSEALLARRMWYTVPHPMRRGARVHVEHEQQILAKSDAGFVAMNKVTPDAPQIGKCMHILTQVVGKHAGPRSTRVTATVTTDWCASGALIAMVKPFVSKNAPEGSRRYFERLRAELIRLPPGDGTVAPPPPSAATPAAVPAAAADAGVAQPPRQQERAAVAGGGGGAAVAGLHATVCVLMGLLVVVVAVLVHVMLELRRSSRALEAVLAAAGATGMGPVAAAAGRT